MPVKAHVHRYVRAVGRLTNNNKESGFVNYYKCADSECSHYQKDFLVIGKRSVCNRCGAEFVLPNALRLLTNRPHCKACTKSKTVKIAIDIPSLAAQGRDWDVEDD